MFATDQHCGYAFMKEYGVTHCGRKPCQIDCDTPFAIHHGNAKCAPTGWQWHRVKVFGGHGCKDVVTFVQCPVSYTEADLRDEGKEAAKELYPGAGSWRWTVTRVDRPSQKWLRSEISRLRGIIRHCDKEIIGLGALLK